MFIYDLTWFCFCLYDIWKNVLVCRSASSIYVLSRLFPGLNTALFIFFELTYSQIQVNIFFYIVFMIYRAFPHFEHSSSTIWFKYSLNTLFFNDSYFYCSDEYKTEFSGTFEIWVWKVQTYWNVYWFTTWDIIWAHIEQKYDIYILVFNIVAPSILEAVSLERKFKPY